MEEVSPRFSGAIILSLVLAFTLTILPLPSEWIPYRPEWIVLAIFHWGLRAPNKSSFMLVWFAGLLVDVIYGVIIGLHAFGSIAVLLATLRVRSRLMLDSLFQQSILLFAILFIYLILTGNSPTSWEYWGRIATSLIIWPLYRYLLSYFHAVKKPFE